MALGTILTSGTNQQSPSIYAGHTIALIGLGVIGGWVTLRITASISRAKYVPQMVESQCEIFTKSTQYLKYGGVLERDLPHQSNISESTRKERLATVTRWLDQIGTLIDVPRVGSEDDASYHARLQRFFEE